jgi:hypothetical protein
MILRWAHILLFLLVTTNSWPQEDERYQDIIHFAESLEEAMIHHTDTFWYSGRIFGKVLGRSLESPFFPEQQNIPGKILFNGRWHNDLELIMSLQHPQKGLIYIILSKSWVEQFELYTSPQSHSFLNNQASDKFMPGLPSGLPEIIAVPPLKLFLKHPKMLEFKHTSSDPFVYEYSRRVFLLKDGALFNVDQKSDFLTTFPEYKKEIRRFLNARNIDYERAGKAQLIRIKEFTSRVIDTGFSPLPDLLGDPDFQIVTFPAGDDPGKYLIRLTGMDASDRIIEEFSSIIIE